MKLSSMIRNAVFAGTLLVGGSFLSGCNNSGHNFNGYSNGEYLKYYETCRALAAKEQYLEVTKPDGTKVIYHSRDQGAGHEFDLVDVSVINKGKTNTCFNDTAGMTAVREAQSRYDAYRKEIKKEEELNDIIALRMTQPNFQ